ncbi:MAG: peroxiredoxin [Cytophagales bacterium]
MSLRKGSKAPLFSVPSTSGQDFSLADRKGKITILYFYPKDFTYGCTKEACSFRDEFESFRELDIDVFGINKDKISTHNKFREELNLPFHLLSDENAKVAKKYDAVLPVIGMIKRITYLIDEELRIIGKFESLTGFDKHVRKILALNKN